MKLSFLPWPLDSFIWTLYSTEEKTPGIVYMKHPSDFATAMCFTTNTLATHFMRSFNLVDHKPVRLSYLGTPSFPNFTSWIPAAEQIIIFWSEKDLKDYFEDRQAFVDRSTLTRYHVKYTQRPEDRTSASSQ